MNFRRISASLMIPVMVALHIVIGLAQTSGSDFEIVESYPVETMLDNPDIRNTETVWLEMIAAAQATLDIEQFYICNRSGEPLEAVIRAIVQAARRGVKIRIIVDKNMARTYPETVERLQRFDRIAVRKIDVFNKNGGVQHSKYFIVDGEQVFLGSQNFDWRALKHIHEIGVRIRDQHYARILTRIFDLDWMQAETGKLHAIRPGKGVEWLPLDKSEDSLKILPTASPYGNVPAGIAQDLDRIVELIDGAQSRVYVQLLSYSPSARRNVWFGDLHNALMRAARRGVDVRLLCSDWCQKSYEIPYLKELVRISHLDVKLSTIPQWSGGYIPYSRVEHCKLMVVDNKLSWIGTGNWKREYFFDSRNLGLVIDSKSVNQRIAEIFLKGWNGPYSWPIQIDKEYTPKQYGEKR